LLADIVYKGCGAADCFGCSQTQFLQDSRVNAKKSHCLFLLKRIEMLWTWRTFYWYGMWFSKSVRNPFVISWAAPKCRQRRKWERTDAMGYSSLKDSFQTRVTGWTPKEKARPKPFFFGIQKENSCFCCKQFGKISSCCLPQNDREL